MLIIIKATPTEDIIGLKEEIALRLEDVVGVEFIDVKEDGCGYSEGKKSDRIS